MVIDVHTHRQKCQKVGPDPLSEFVSMPRNNVKLNKIQTPTANASKGCKQLFGIKRYKANVAEDIPSSFLQVGLLLCLSICLFKERMLLSP